MSYCEGRHPIMCSLHGHIMVYFFILNYQRYVLMIVIRQMQLYMNILHRYRYLNMYCKNDPSFLYCCLICAPVLKMSLQLSVMGIAVTWWIMHWLSPVDKRVITTQCDHEKEYLTCPEHVGGPTVLMRNWQLSFLILCHNPPGLFY